LTPAPAASSRSPSELLDQKLQSAGEIAKGSDLDRIEGLSGRTSEKKFRLRDVRGGRELDCPQRVRGFYGMLGLHRFSLSSGVLGALPSSLKGSPSPREGFFFFNPCRSRTAALRIERRSSAKAEGAEGIFR